MTRAHRFPSGRPEVEDPMLWAERAECKGQPISMFFPHGGPGLSDPAKALCAVCEVQTECLTYALRTDQPDGVWGSLTAAERQALPYPRVRPIPHGTTGGYKQHYRRGELPCEPCRHGHREYRRLREDMA